MHRFPTLAPTLAALAGLGLACATEEPEAPAEPTPPAPLYAGASFTGPWQPGRILRLALERRQRGWREVRGIAHAHSVYSHDACDGQPFGADGKPDATCMEDLRTGVCKVGHAFLMLSDHSSTFAEHEFPEVLQYRPELGDELIERGGVGVANRLACADGARVLVLAGNENGGMPLGLEGHAAATVAERKTIYSGTDAASIEKWKAGGAVAIAHHTEDWSVEQLTSLPFDGLEGYNLHANMMARLNDVLKVVPVLLGEEGTPPHPDLVLLSFVSEDPRYSSRWGSALAAGKRRVATMATDCHRNSIDIALSDGERVDSYRRMMGWFSNHLLVETAGDGSFDDRALKEALRSGRAFGVFELLGYPEGFDFYAEVKGATFEMGEAVSLAAKPRLRVSAPRLVLPDPKAKAPEISVRLLEAKAGGFAEVAAGKGDLEFGPSTAGAYRAEVRIRPLHLAGFVGSLPDLATRDYAWIVANPIYVVP